METALYLSFLSTLFDHCESLVLECLSEGLSPENKSDSSVVTKADKKCEEFIREYIAEHFPSHGVLGEEFGLDKRAGEYLWLCDPIDGTEELVQGLPTWGIVIGLWENGVPLVGGISHPLLNIRVIAGKQQGAFLNGKALAKTPAHSGKDRIGLPKGKNFFRNGDEGTLRAQLSERFLNARCFDTALHSSEVACRGLDAALEWNIRDWDIAATEILMQETGQEFIRVESSGRDPQGFPWVKAVYGHAELVAELQDLIHSRSLSV